MKRWLAFLLMAVLMLTAGTAAADLVWSDAAESLILDDALSLTDLEVFPLYYETDATKNTSKDSDFVVDLGTVYSDSTSIIRLMLNATVKNDADSGMSPFQINAQKLVITEPDGDVRIIDKTTGKNTSGPFIFVPDMTSGWDTTNDGSPYKSTHQNDKKFRYIFEIVGGAEKRLSTLDLGEYTAKFELMPRYSSHQYTGSLTLKFTVAEHTHASWKYEYVDTSWHKEKCSMPGCDRVSFVSHRPVDEEDLDCLERLTCKDCGQEYGDPKWHTYNSPANCKEERVCLECGYHTGEYGDHKPVGGFIPAGFAQHAKKCSVCDKYINHEYHEYENEADRKCDICGYERDTGFEVIPETLTLYIGDTYQLKAQPEVEGYELSWGSSDKYVATVDETGKITAKNKGVVEIKAYLNEKTRANYSAICTVTVIDPDDGLDAPAPHMHHWTFDLEYNQTHHWHGCEVEGCEEKKDYAEHSFNEFGICTECFYFSEAGGEDPDVPPVTPEIPDTEIKVIVTKKLAGIDASDLPDGTVFEFSFIDLSDNSLNGEVLGNVGFSKSDLMAASNGSTKEVPIRVPGGKGLVRIGVTETGTERVSGYHVNVNMECSGAAEPGDKPEDRGDGSIPVGSFEIDVKDDVILDGDVNLPFQPIARETTEIPVVEIIITNTLTPIKIDLPKTGDESNLALWACAMLLSGAAGMVLLRKKREA